MKFKVNSIMEAQKEILETQKVIFQEIQAKIKFMPTNKDAPTEAVDEVGYFSNGVLPLNTEEQLLEFEEKLKNKEFWQFAVFLFLQLYNYFKFLLNLISSSDEPI